MPIEFLALPLGNSCIHKKKEIKVVRNVNNKMVFYELDFPKVYFLFTPQGIHTTARAYLNCSIYELIVNKNYHIRSFPFCHLPTGAFKE